MTIDMTPQAYPLFLAEIHDGKPRVGRIIGWIVQETTVPQAVVLFDGTYVGAIASFELVDLSTDQLRWVSERSDQSYIAAATYAESHPEAGAQ